MDTTQDGISQQIFSRFISAVKSGSIQEVQEIIRTSNPAIVNKIQPQSRHPAIYFAVLVPEEHIAQQLIKILIRNGANYKFKDHNEQTVIFYICRQGKEQCAQILLSHGLSLDDVDSYGQTPLFYAVNQNRLEIVRKYSTKERVNHADNLAAQTPLYYAARRGHLEMCKILIQKGADICHQDANGKNAIELARKAKFYDVAEYLNNEYKRLKDGNKFSMMSQSIEDSKSNIQKKKKKQSSVKSSRQTYKIVFLNDKGQPHDLTEEEVRQMVQAAPQLQRYLTNPESIPQDMFEAVSLDNWQKVASKILTHICKLKGAYWFQEPVDPVKYNIMDYFDIITKPMDLGSVRKKISHNCYSNAQEFIADMNLIWQNCYKYNGEVHQISKCAKEIQNAFLESVSSFGLDKYIQSK